MGRRLLGPARLLGPERRNELQKLRVGLVRQVLPGPRRERSQRCHQHE